MHNTDARRLTRDELTELRKRGVAAVQNGEAPVATARILGVAVSTMFGWLALYRRGGWGALDARKRGGRPTKLNGRMLKWVYDTVTMKDPRQLKFPFALWTAPMVSEAVWRRFRVRLSKASTCRLMHQLGLSPQKPLWRAFQKNPEAVRNWIEKDFPRIRRLARREKADIYFADEAGVRSDAHRGTTWAVKGDTPVVATTGARFGLNVVSAVTRRGTMRFMIVHGTVTAEVFVQFLDRLLHNAPRKVFLIVDGHPSHRSCKVSTYVEGTAGRLRLFFLPGYSPELNPDELVWNDMKATIGRKVVLGPDHLKKEVLSHLHSLQRNPDRIRSFFQAPDTAYAAAS